MMLYGDDWRIYHGRVPRDLRSADQEMAATLLSMTWVDDVGGPSGSGAIE